MLRLFPHLQVKDNWITEFYADPRKCKVDNKAPLNPDLIGFKRPDFGFDDDLDFEADDEERAELWVRFMDCVSLCPHFERV